MSGNWQVVRTGRDLDKAEGGRQHFWTDDIEIETEIVGPFPSKEAAIEAATSDAEPAAHPRDHQLILLELLISKKKFIKVRRRGEAEREKESVKGQGLRSGG